MPLQRTLVAVAALVLSCVQMPFASAEDWPTRPVRILIGFGAGGGTDVATRVVADGLSKALGQQFVVENRVGAGGTIAGGVVAKSDKDGYTALAISMGHSVSAVMVKNVPYDAVNDFAPIGIFTNSAFVVAVPKNSPATDIKSLVEYVNKQPGKRNTPDFHPFAIWLGAILLFATGCAQNGLLSAAVADGALAAVVTVFAIRGGTW